MAAKRNASGLTFKATMAQISVPATSANIGPGFDCFGLALELRDRYAAQVLDDETLNDNSPLRNQDDEGYFNNLIDRDSKEEMKKRREENKRENERMEKEISRRRMNISNQEITQKVYLIWEEKCKKRKRISSKDREEALHRIVKDIKDQEKQFMPQ